MHDVKGGDAFASSTALMITIQYVGVMGVHIAMTVRWEEELVPKRSTFQQFSTVNVIARFLLGKVGKKTQWTIESVDWLLLSDYPYWDKMLQIHEEKKRSNECKQG